MKNNSQKGFIVPLVIGIVAVLIIAGAYLVYKNESGQGEESDQASGQFITSTTTTSTMSSTTTIDNVRTNATTTSTSTQPAPVITSINPSSGPIGTIVELKGSNLAGFEGELDAWIENSNGEKAFLPGIGSVPRADQTIRVKIDSQLCKENLSYKGGPCSSYMTITPGIYKIYTYPWGNMSNTVQFIVTASSSSTAWKTYSNSQYGFELKYPNGYFLTENKIGISIESSQTCKTIRAAASGSWPKDCLIYDLLIQKNKILVEGSGVTKTATQVAGYSAEKIQDNNQGMWDGMIQTTIQFNKDNQWYINRMSFNLETKTASESMLNQILSTFKFVSTKVSSPQPSITVLSPNGGETFRAGVDPLSVSWIGKNLTSNDSVKFAFVDTNGVITETNARGAGLDLRATGGSAELMIYSSVKSGSYRLKITDDYGNSDMSDNYFTITN
jgi:hypothetical protein